MNVQQIKIDFNVTEKIKRYVYVYLITGNYCYLIDSGVDGCEQQIIDAIKESGKELPDLKGIFLTHAHPDHIGTADWFKEQTGCKIYASKGESKWIEDVDLQFKERPILNFYKLAGKPVKVDIPIYVDKEASLNSLERINNMNECKMFYPAWDVTYDKSMIKCKIADAIDLIHNIDVAVKEAQEKNDDNNEIVSRVCEILHSLMLMSNPLFIRTIESHLV